MEVSSFDGTNHYDNAKSAIHFTLQKDWPYCVELDYSLLKSDLTDYTLWKKITRNDVIRLKLPVLVLFNYKFPVFN